MSAGLPVVRPYGWSSSFFWQSMFNCRINKFVVMKKICSLCHASTFDPSFFFNIDYMKVRNLQRSCWMAYLSLLGKCSWCDLLLRPHPCIHHNNVSLLHNYQFMFQHKHLLSCDVTNRSCHSLLTLHLQVCISRSFHCKGCSKVELCTYKIFITVELAINNWW